MVLPSGLAWMPRARFPRWMLVTAKGPESIMLRSPGTSFLTNMRVAGDGGGVWAVSTGAGLEHAARSAARPTVRTGAHCLIVLRRSLILWREVMFTYITFFWCVVCLRWRAGRHPGPREGQRPLRNR